MNDYFKNINYNNREIVTIIGAGAGGQTTAGYLAASGIKVNLYNRTLEKIAPIMDSKEIQLIGAIEATAKLNKVTVDILEAIENAALIMVFTTATGHYDIAKLIAPFVQNEQIIILNSEGAFSCLEFINALIQYGCKKNPIICETDGILYATRLEKPGLCNVKGIKKSVDLSIVPFFKAQTVFSVLSSLIPQFSLNSNLLKMGLQSSMNGVLHVPIMLGNKQRIQNNEKFLFYCEGATKEIVAIIEELDQERMAVATKLGFQTDSLFGWLQRVYHLEAENLYEALKTNPAYQNIDAPTTLKMRLLTEDVSTSLVPLAEIGRSLGVKVQKIEEYIAWASFELATDFKNTGRNLQRLGLDSRTIEEDLMRFGNLEITAWAKR